MWLAAGIGPQGAKRAAFWIKKGERKAAARRSELLKKTNEQAGAKSPNVRLRVLPNVSYNEIAGDVKVTRTVVAGPEG